MVLTVGYVAGFISAALFVAQIWAPTALAFILSGILRDKNTAATWSVASRALEQSHWPAFVRSDTAKSYGVRKDVLILNSMITFMGILIAIAGIVTPLGLYEDLQPARQVTPTFGYLRDTGPFGFGTPPRTNFSLSRICSRGFLDDSFRPCPFTDSIVTASYLSNGTLNVEMPYGIDISIPKTIIDIYSSGVGNDTTISNFIDIQYRRYAVTSNSNYNNGSSFLIDSFRPMGTKALDNTIEPVEGLIVDTVQGAIGFRNHTVPPGFQFGATWNEDLLFIEPETVCVDTNITLDYSIGNFVNLTTSILDLVLTDRGGFSNISHEFPSANLTNPQANPDLQNRAYVAAWITNTYTMLLYNVTNPRNATSGEEPWSYLNTHVGKAFPLDIVSDAGFYDALGMDDTFSSHLSIDPVAADATNIFQITAANFTNAGLLCGGAGGADFANVTNILVKCGLMRGVPQRQTPGSSINFDVGSRWSQPLYTCATAVKATIKTASFNYNGTGGVENLKIPSVRPKNYSDTSSMPLWGYENTGNTYTLDQLPMIWGLISSEYENNPNVSSVRQESLYLTGYYDSLLSNAGLGSGARDSVENVPATDFYTGAMGNAYAICDPGSTGCYTTRGYLDYTGNSNMAMWARWQNLSSSATTAGLIPNLIFTDYAAAAVVGTKGVLGPGNSASSNLVKVDVLPLHSVIRYHWAFSIPGIFTALCLIIFTIVAFITIFFHRHNVSNMRTHLNQLAPGRIFTTLLYPEHGLTSLSSKEWSKQMGKHVIDLSSAEPVASDVSEVPEVHDAQDGQEGQEMGTVSTNYQLVSGQHSAEQLVSPEHIRYPEKR